ncbi:MAG: SPOR domain-containing protein [Novosphingobium sp.]|nr:SPOR domain-containing protein [Novosphingobium sp.]
MAISDENGRDDIPDDDRPNEGRPNDDQPAEAGDSGAQGREPWEAAAPGGEEEPAVPEYAPEHGAQQLPLDDDEVRLPWLEAGDDDEEETSSSGGLVRLMLLGLAALALIVGAIWVVTHRGKDRELVADGGVIAAPEAPYKEKPADPGGKTFAGTGDTSFAVSEGQSRPARIGAGDASPQPGFTTAGRDAAQPAGKAAVAVKPTEGASPAAAPAAASGVGVQVGAYSSRTAAEAGWQKLAQMHGGLSGHAHRVVEGKADIGTVYRLQAVAADAAAARALCKDLRSAGLACQVKN